MLNRKINRFILSLLLLVSSTFLFIPAAYATACSPTSTTYGSYTVLSFTTTGTCTWTAPSDISTADILLIGGGGGGGGGAFGGGGGAGGFVEKLNHTIAPGNNYSIDVGDGGNGGTATLTNANYPGGNFGIDGSDTTFDSLTAKGGGGGAGFLGAGGSRANAAGRSGGSGGGASEGGGASSGGTSTQNSFSGATTYGNAGGSSVAADSKSGGGGGGAGGVGQNAEPNSPTTRYQGGVGGSGATSVLRTGSAVTYAAGGDGGSNGAGPDSDRTAESANTGNGGDGANWYSTPRRGGDGGSGILVIRYIANSSSGGGTTSTEPQIWLGKYSIECPLPNPGTNETIKTTNKVTPLDATNENLVGKNISQETLDLLGKKEIYFDFWSKKVKTATIELPSYGCNDKLVKINKNNSIQFIAGGFNLQSEARGYLQTPDEQWFDLTGVTLYKDTAAFLHTIKFVQPGDYLIVLSEQPNTDAGLLPTYGYKNARFVLQVFEKTKTNKTLKSKVSSRSTQFSTQPTDFKALSQRSIWTNQTTKSNYSYILLVVGLMIFFFYRRRNISFSNIEPISMENKFTNYVENLYEQIISKN